MSKSVIKFYVIPGVIALLLVLVLLLVPLNKKKSDDSISKPTPTVIIVLPTKSFLPNERVAPSIIPPQSFTGADINQELPTDLRMIGEQKTALRRLTPLTLPFGTIEFDYENDIFLVRLTNQSAQIQQEFVSWRDENYPALTQDRFAFR